MRTETKLVGDRPSIRVGVGVIGVPTIKIKNVHRCELAYEKMFIDRPNKLHEVVNIVDCVRLNSIVIKVLL